MAGENNNNLSVEIRANTITSGTVVVANNRLVNPSFSFDPITPLYSSPVEQWPDPQESDTFGQWLLKLQSVPNEEINTNINVTRMMPDYLANLIQENRADCADVTILLRHYYLLKTGRSFVFTAGESEVEWVLGYGLIVDAHEKIPPQTGETYLRNLLQNVGGINLREGAGRGRRQVINFLAGQYNPPTAYIQPGTQIVQPRHEEFEPGYVVLWRYINVQTDGETSVGHSQTIQWIDRDAERLAVLQGGMERESGRGLIYKKIYTFESFRNLHNRENSRYRFEFAGAGPWIERTD